MTNKKFYVFAWLIAAITLSGLFFLLPKTNCCDESDPELEKLIDRGFAGEIEAITILYERSKKEGVAPMEEYWALEGALLGSNSLRGAYVQIFNTRIEADRQQLLLERIKQRSTMPGALCVLESLGSPIHPAPVCAE